MNECPSGECDGDETSARPSDDEQQIPAQRGDRFRRPEFDERIARQGAAITEAEAVGWFEEVERQLERVARHRRIERQERGEGNRGAERSRGRSADDIASIRWARPCTRCDDGEKQHAVVGTSEQGESPRESTDQSPPEGAKSQASQDRGKRGHSQRKARPVREVRDLELEDQRRKREEGERGHSSPAGESEFCGERGERAQLGDRDHTERESVRAREQVAGGHDRRVDRRVFQDVVTVLDGGEPRDEGLGVSGRGGRGEVTVEQGVGLEKVDALVGVRRQLRKDPTRSDRSPDGTPDEESCHQPAGATRHVVAVSVSGTRAP